MFSMHGFVFTAREVARDFAVFARERNAEQAEVLNAAATAIWKAASFLEEKPKRQQSATTLRRSSGAVPR